MRGKRGGGGERTAGRWKIGGGGVCKRNQRRREWERAGRIFGERWVRDRMHEGGGGGVVGRVKSKECGSVSSVEMIRQARFFTYREVRTGLVANPREQRLKILLLGPGGRGRLGAIYSDPSNTGRWWKGDEKFSGRGKREKPYIKNLWG